MTDLDKKGHKYNPCSALPVLRYNNDRTQNFDTQGFVVDFKIFSTFFLDKINQKWYNYIKGIVLTIFMSFLSKLHIIYNMNRRKKWEK